MVMITVSTYYRDAGVENKQEKKVGEAIWIYKENSWYSRGNCRGEKEGP